MKRYYFILFQAVWLLGAFAQKPSFLEESYQKAAQIQLEKMTLREKVSQLFLAPVFSSKDPMLVTKAQELLQEYPLGGILFSLGTVHKQRKLIDAFNKTSKLPLLIAQDAEWGMAMRLKDFAPYPRQMTLGAITDKNLLFTFGVHVGNECRMAGVHLNFAPVVDINSNPDNPVIHTRSLGSTPFKVGPRAVAIIDGMQSVGVLACCKHFPGHGDTAVDSHIGLPVVTKTIAQLSSMELSPFQEAIDAGVSGVMTAHLSLPQIDDKIATLSPTIMTDLLQKKMGFEGLVVTDALNMQAIEKNIPVYIASYLALKAGSDLCIYLHMDDERLKRLLTVDIPQAIEFVEEKIQEGEFSEKELDHKVKKILAIKSYINSRWSPLDPDLAKSKSNLIARLFESAQTVYKEKGSITLGKKSKSIAVVHIGPAPKVLIKELSRKYKIKSFGFPKTLDLKTAKKFANYDGVVISYATENVQHIEQQKKELLDVDLDTLNMIHAQSKKTVGVLFSTPYVVHLFDALDNVLISYENHNASQRAAAKVLMGHNKARGKIPVAL